MTSTTPHRLATVAQVEAVIGRAPAPVLAKQITALDEGCRAVLARCPLAAFGHRDADGVQRTTFVGGAPGFARVHSPTRISFPLPGARPRGPVSFTFLLPGVGETLRLNGKTAGRAGDEQLVDVLEAYVHCAQAVIRSDLWQPPVPADPAPRPEGAGPLSAPEVADFLAAARFLALSTEDGDGGSDTSPRGDLGGAAHPLDARTLAIPDRRGNKRADTLHNLVRDDRVSFAALVPGRTDVLHVSGRASITTDPDLLEPLALRGIPPHAALLVAVEHAEVTPNAALTHSRAWSPQAHARQGEVPDLMVLAGDHLAANLAARKGFVPRLLAVFTRIPGLGAFLRLVINRSYRANLREEGYGDVRLTPACAEPPPHEVEITEVRGETPDAVTLVLTSERPFDFHPGQFFTLLADLDGEPVRRSYSASSAPGGTTLELTVKRVPDGRFSTHATTALRAGDRLALRGPSGAFHLNPTETREVVLLAAGSGITPLMSMIRALLATDAPARISLLRTDRTAQDEIFADELTTLARHNPDRLTVTSARTAEQGRLDATRVGAWLTTTAPSERAHYYACGPDPLVALFRELLTTRGVPPEHVHHERYTTAAPTRVAAPQPLLVVDGARTLGSTVVEPGQTLLDAALAAGLPMPHSCTVGSCGDCAVALRAGEVTMTEPNCLPPARRAAGEVLTCVGCPLSPVTVDVSAR
ncbi:2Fe-2S iron-sulfur cluster-binding protein [Actinosynnema mirum]|uniref:Oxidoreductase FAD-binding domain protein n=1 Tax=Actinosynnema mirum (strain ATCC 29888 / DSM 43827 / JCM 3225 / NBRC 14064 / NCIMB 13271 / NRRL B-12336 / IMRU 3971 / 101) TaxID=446462 RepID=C6WK98_ACTMD|nr:2Fe-2S iron-sulfur cluster-binding protein [Actinosynnema mirum]ACU38311.1 Oxidoreductase FAD-binding domain protein [Actinosynnema mirum DSM 43827]